MKKLIILTFLSFVASVSFGQVVKFKITNDDPVTHKKVVAFLSNLSVGVSGAPSIIQYIEKQKETDENTDAVPAGTTQKQIEIMAPTERTFILGNRTISSVTRLFVPSDDPNAVTLESYFANKSINSFPGVQGGDPAWKFYEGQLREVIEILKLNGQLPN